MAARLKALLSFSFCLLSTTAALAAGLSGEGAGGGAAGGAAGGAGGRAGGGAGEKTAPTAAATTGKVSPAEFAILNRIRFFAARGHENDLVGGSFSGSNTGDDGDFQELAKIVTAPQPDQWSELRLENTKPYRFVRYDAPAGSHCRIAEIEFYAGNLPLRGEGFGSVGENEAPGAWRKAFDGKTDSFVQTVAADGQYVGMDLFATAACKKPTMTPAPGVFSEPTKVTLASRTIGATIRYTTDGTQPTAENGITYSGPIAVAERTSIEAAAFKDGVAASPVAFGVYQIGEAGLHLHTLHVGNSLTASTHALPLFASTIGIEDDYRSFLHGGATTKVLWNDATGPKKEQWQKALNSFTKVDHFTLQPRDFDIAEEANYDLFFLNAVREKFPLVKPWLYAEWVEFERQRPTDQGREASRQMSKIWPALTWEESMAAMVLYVEDLQAKLAEVDKAHTPPQIIPSALAMGWMHRLIEEGKVPGMKPGSFHARLFRDGVHPNDEGCYLVDLTWISAFTGKPASDARPLGTKLTPAQAAIMQQLSWDVIRNYPASGWYQEGSKKVKVPGVRKLETRGDVTTVKLKSKTPGAWFRYTLDGSEPSRTRGYIYCGLISLRSGMKLEAVAYKSGMADSPVMVMEQNQSAQPKLK